jgi:hypothetical protein
MSNEPEPSLTPDPIDIELRGDFQFILIRENPGKVAGDEGFVNPEGEIMIVAGCHFDADEDENAVVGPFIPVMLGLKPVMIGKHDEVYAGCLGRLDDLHDRCAPVMRIIGMEVDDACVIVKFQDKGVTLFSEPRFQDFIPNEHVALSLPLCFSPPRYSFYFFAD